jgi:endonuclease YncB( thermonuclease family)
MSQASERSTLDLSQFTPEQQSEIEKILKNTRPQSSTNRKPVQLTKPTKQVKEPETKKRVRTRRMSKVNGFTMLMHLTSDNKSIRIQCVDSPEEFVLIPIDWALAKKAAKALANFVKAKVELDSFRTHL